MEENKPHIPAPTTTNLEKSLGLNNQKTEWIELKSEGKTLSGNFMFRRLTIGQIAQVGADISRRSGGVTVDETTEMINTMLAHFRAAIIGSPDWWKPEDLYDIAILREVYERLMAFEKSFRNNAGEQGSGTQVPS